MTVTFAIATYGETFLGMLIACIYSIEQSNPGAQIVVFWQDIDKQRLAVLSQAFTKVRFIKTAFQMPMDKRQRIGSKVLMWEYAIGKLSEEGVRRLCLIDVDVLVIRDIASYFDANDYDILFTDKDEEWPLNTGVLLVRPGRATQIFFKHWRQQTAEIVNDDSLLEQARNRKLPYGGPSQMSLHLMLGYVPEQKHYTIVLEEATVRLRAVPCEQLNQTRRTKITPSTHIVHYKGGWHPILLSGRDFSRGRPRKKLWEMYMLFLQTYCRAIEHINKQVNGNFTSESFGIRIPFYINRDTLEHSQLLYLYYRVHFRAARKIESLREKSACWKKPRCL